ncbi:MAG: hypothetical protein QOH21_1042 [Acidobacteriota bacterium]|nr:hypothetical protein [Acidobacteriota bacterium]
MSDDSLPPFDDLLTAFARLAPKNAETRRAIAATLGFSFAGNAVQKAPAIKEPHPPPKKESESLAVPPSRHPVPEARTIATPAQAQLVSVLRRSASAPRPPDWLDHVEPLPPTVAAEPPPLEPLFVSRWMRGIIAAAAATRAPHGPLDIDAIARTVSRGATFREIPRIATPSTARALQVLVDGSEPMLPFAADQEWLVERIRSIAGIDRTQVLGIEARDGFRAGSGSVFGWTAYPDTHPPLPGMVVLLLSDLGIGHAPFRGWVSPERWATLIGALQRTGARVVAFVPYPPERWPRLLLRALPIVQWDVKTNARRVRRAVGRLATWHVGEEG